MSAADVRGATAPRRSAFSSTPLPAPPPGMARQPSSRRRPLSRWGSVGAVTTAAMSSALAVAALSPGDAPIDGIAAVSMLVGFVIAGLLVLRRRFPVPLCVAACATAVVLPLDSFAALLTLTWVIASASRRAAWWCAAATTLATAVALRRDAVRDPAHMVFSTTDSVTGTLSYTTATGFWILGTLCVATAVGVGLARRWRNVAAAAVADKDAQVATSSELRDRMTRQEERELIAREVHDTVAHHISLISLQASALEVDRDMDEPRIRAATQQMRSSAQQAIAEMRGLLTTLRAGGEDDLLPGTTLEDLAGLLDDLRRHGRWVTSSVFVTDSHTAAPALTRAVFRIVQESVTNALKHAPGQPIEVDVRAGRQVGVTIRVANPVAAPNGAAAPGTGSGILGMRERAEQFGGRLDIRVEHGWHVVTATLPWVPVD